jgi:ubiquinone biosynthesis protein UbiJ
MSGSSLNNPPSFSSFSRKFSPVLAQMFQKIIQADPDYLTLGTDLQGAIFQLTLTEWEISLVFSPDRENGKIKILSAAEFFEMASQREELVSPDVAIMGRLPDFLALIRTASSSLVKSHIQIQGDVRVLARYQTFFQRWNIDWGYVLASTLGEGPARVLYSPLKKLSEFLQYQHTERIQDLKEVLYEEKRLLVPQAELESFYSDLKQLQMRVDRLIEKYRLKG